MLEAYNGPDLVRSCLVQARIGKLATLSKRSYERYQCTSPAWATTVNPKLDSMSREANLQRLVLSQIAIFRNSSSCWLKPLHSYHGLLKITETNSLCT